VQQLSRQQTPETQLLLNQRLSEESDPGVQKAIKAALAGIAEGLAWGDRLGRSSAASAWARCCCWRRWVWPSPTA
jgi:hypothetical protein